ncbi:MAG: hypothetical protein JWO11_1390 [Nocardioides sp.]|nr:hypothetical protein [Nocardioides sp.]
MRVTRRERAPIEVARGERVLAWAQSAEGPVGGTRDALYVPGARIPWEQVEAADWDSDFSVLRVSEVGTWGVVRPMHKFSFEEPGLLLELVRERVTASVVLQRHIAVEGRRGLRVIARRAPRGDRPLSWMYEYDEGIDPADPLVQQAAGEALAAARDEVGEV